MSEEVIAKLEQARASLIDAVMHLNEVADKMGLNTDTDDDGDALHGAVDEDSDLTEHIAKLEEISEILEELQSRYE